MKIQINSANPLSKEKHGRPATPESKHPHPGSATLVKASISYYAMREAIQKIAHPVGLEELKAFYRIG